MQPQVQDNIPYTQYGGVAGGGTDIPNHTIRSLLQYAKLCSLSIFVLFLDLEKAFDKVIREIVMGWPQSPDGAFASEEQQLRYLCSIGVDESAAQHIVGLMREAGSVFQRWQVDPKVEALVRGLHSKAWFRVGDNASVVVTSTGGRQGCKLGGIIFNSVYEQALERVRTRLKEAGVVLVLKAADQEPFWSPESGSSDVHDVPVVEVTYVDDEAAAVVASSPATLDTAIDCMLRAYCEVFAMFGLSTNWQKGKSEGLLAYRGRHAARHLEARRSPSGELLIAVPGAASRQLHIVPSYDHLGGTICTNWSVLPEAAKRASSALAAYAPIAGKVIGADFISVHLRLCLMCSLDISRLLYDIHTLTMSVAGLRKLNGPYMRTLRAIAGRRRFAVTDNSTDLEVRRVVGQPSVDSLVLQRRLAYYPRLAQRRPDALVALLQSSCAESRISWVNQVARDLDFVYEHVRSLELPAPHLDPGAWLAVMLHEGPQWRLAVEECSYVHSVLDAVVDSECPEACVAHMCALCGDPRPAFASPKVLASHQRCAHGVRNPMRAFADADGRCPVCAPLFHSRLRLLAHLSDTRRPKCRNILLAGSIQPLPKRRIDELDVADKLARRAAQREGRSHPFAARSALTSDGQCIGHVQL